MRLVHLPSCALTCLFAGLLLTGCFPDHEPPRYYEGELKLEVNGNIYDFTNTWKCETSKQWSLGEGKFNTVTRQENWPSQIYKVQTLKGGAILLYQEWRWCKPGNHAPEMFEITLIDDLNHPAYGEVLRLKISDAPSVLDQQNKKFTVKLLAAGIRRLDSAVSITPRTDVDKAALTILRNTVAASRTVTVEDWRNGIYYKRALKQLGNVWTVDSTDFPLDRDKFDPTNSTSYPFIPISSHQLATMPKHSDEVTISYDGKLSNVKTGSFAEANGAVKGSKRAGFRYEIKSFGWSHMMDSELE